VPNSKFHPTYLIFTLFFIVFLHGQSDVDLQIEVIEVEYIDAETQEITYLDATTSVDATLKLSRDYNHVYVALKKDPSIQYAYKVTGEAGLLNWKNTNSELHLVGLSRGAHRLYIRGERQGVFSTNTYALNILIPTPFYLKWWFISLNIIAVVLLFYFFLSLESKLLKERKDRNLEVSNLEAKAYRAQMNPHFIFNALNGMQSAMVLGGEKEFNKYITSFSKLIHDTTEMSRVDRISIADEIKYITNYIRLQSLRLENQITLHLTVAAEINKDEVFMPCMMLQPIVENSIVHGIIPKKADGFISIDISTSAGTLLVIVEDDGIGRKAAEKEKERYQKTHKSFATQIMRDRIDIFNYYNKDQLSFTIDDLYDKDGSAAGTKVTLSLPLDLKTRHR
jgi:hypothetical protein